MAAVGVVLVRVAGKVMDAVAAVVVGHYAQMKAATPDHYATAIP